MKKTSKYYKKVISQLEDLYQNSKDMAKDGSKVWRDDMEALQVAMDIIEDYEKMSEQVSRLVNKYEVGKLLVKRNTGIYSCPECGSLIKKTNRNHCYNCGQRILWLKKKDVKVAKGNLR